MKETKTNLEAPMGEDEMIVYFHGFNSSSESSTCTALQNHFGKDKVVATCYDYINPVNAFAYLDGIIAPLMATHTVLLVGTSLGGFWANHFAEKYRLHCALVNPSLNPGVSLAQYLGENTNFHTGEKATLTTQHLEAYKQYIFGGTPLLHKSILLGSKDIVVDPIFTRQIMKNHYIVEAPNEGHQIQDKQLVIDLVERAWMGVRWGKG